MVTKKSDYAIETISLTKIFPDWWGRARVVAVENLNLKVHHNEIYGFLGPNGSGKTTTLKMVLNLLHPTKGRAMVLGGHSSDSKISSRLGYLPEDSYLYRYLSARETLDFYGRIFGLPARTRKSRIDALLDMVGLSGMANRQIGTFSKGMARRIGLAQALINDPDILILDEPTSGMDPIGTRQIKDLLRQLARRGKTILLCSHLLADVEDICDRIGILYGGKMQVEGTVQSLLQHKNEVQINAGSVSHEGLKEIQSVLESENISCVISSPMDRLEDYFINIVSEAQKKNAPTSGAISTMKIEGFLVEKQVEDKTADVLSSLVSKPQDQQAVIKGDDVLEKVEQKPADSVRSANEDLLKSLTSGSVVPVESPQVDIPDELEDTGKADHKPVDMIKEDLLDSLTGKKQSREEGLTDIVEPEKGDTDDE